MLSYLQQLTYWDWLGLGILLLILEVFGAGGYLLWIGLAAACTSLLSFVFPDLSWEAQFSLFGLIAIITAVFWWQRQRKSVSTSAQPGLNQRGSELIGRTFVLHEAIIDGRGKIKAGDTLWLVTGTDAAAGQNVKVIGQDGVLLKVIPE
ncbi:NfeD family protein [Ectopseudomonas mendocina]|uniref:NfeD family protein n=1 Tax=Ectopseudomonas mendocina TaxID=300 RepID=A0ABZ2RHE2_ECTME